MDSQEFIFFGALNMGEKIVWTGRPSQKVRLHFSDYVAFVIIGFIVYGEWVTFDGVFLHNWPMLLYIPMLVILALHIVFGRNLVLTWLQSKISYAITDRRIIIHNPSKKFHLVSIDIKSLAKLQYTEERDGSGSIFIGETESFGELIIRRYFIPDYPRISRIANVKMVFGMILQQLG